MARLTTAPGWGNVSENRWGKVSEKLSRYWGNDSGKRYRGRSFPPQPCDRAQAGANRGPDAQAGGAGPDALDESGCGPEGRRVAHQSASDLAHALQPHRASTFKFTTDLSPRRRSTIVGLYLNPPTNTVVLSLDEKTQIQALSRARSPCYRCGPACRPGRPTTTGAMA
jgi:hypothetical protein